MIIIIVKGSGGVVIRVRTENTRAATEYEIILHESSTKKMYIRVRR